MAGSTSPSRLGPHSTAPAQEASPRKQHRPSVAQAGKNKRREVCGSHPNKARQQSHPPVQARRDGQPPASWSTGKETERPGAARPVPVRSPAVIAGLPPDTLLLPESQSRERSSSPVVYAAWLSPRERRSRQNRSPTDSLPETQDPPHRRAVHAEISAVQELSSHTQARSRTRCQDKSRARLDAGGCAARCGY